MRVVVVGGGVVGTMHAWQAVRLGHDVVHLERDPGPRSASVRNFGLVWVSGRAGGDELRAALRARELWEDLATLVPGVGFRPAGSLTVALDDAEVAVFEDACRRPDAADRGFALLDCAEARTKNPAVRGAFAAALWCERDGVVEPGLVLPALRSALDASGRYRFFSERNVVDCDTGWVADHTGAQHHADLVVLCPGASLSGVGAAALGESGIFRCRLQMMQTEPFEERVPTAVADGDSLRYYPAFDVPALQGLPPQPPVAAEHRMQLLLVQRPNGELTIGDTHAYDEPFDFAVEEAPYDHLRERAERILGCRLPPVRRRWAGVYSQVADSPWLHREVTAGVVIVTGPGGKGMTMSPAIAEATFEAVA